MAATDEVLYEVIVWDFDAAPDGDGYYVWKRFRVSTRSEAVRRAYDWAGDHEDATATGAGVFLGGKLVRGFGLTLEYPNS
jgi:hypothetical protein